MKKRKAYKPLCQDLNFDAFSWCIQNDFQVYVKPVVDITELNGIKEYQETGRYRIAVRRKGISTEGKDYLKSNGKTIKSKETLSEAIFNSQHAAFDNINSVYEYLKEKYG
jgi:hypothetical protein